MRGLSSANRPESNPPCGAAGVELVESQSSDGVVVKLGVGARKGVDNCASNMADEME